MIHVKVSNLLTEALLLQERAKEQKGRWRKFTYDDIIARDKTSLDMTWLKDKSPADLDKLRDPDVLALTIVENLEAGLKSLEV